jgi:hypothetical protein
VNNKKLAATALLSLLMTTGVSMAMKGKESGGDMNMMQMMMEQMMQHQKAMQGSDQ